MDFLDQVLFAVELMPLGLGVQVRSRGNRECAMRAPGMKDEVRVSTDPAYHEAHADSVEFWSPGGEMFERVRP